VYRSRMHALGLRRRRADGSEAIYSPRAILALEMQELEFPRTWPRALRFIGPLAHNPEAIEIDLPLRAPRVLVTIGTHLLWAKQTLLDEVRALARTLPDVSFVVSLGDPARATRAPLLLEERIALYAYVPYRRTLREFDAVIHHAGAGVTSACIEAERPVLAVPHDYDQFDFAARIVHHGLGLSARRIGSDDAAQKLRRLLAEPWPALAQFAAHHARYRPAASFLGVVHELTGTRATGAAA
jgi:UDP:flavonoid glycosyltransferase YjiC (YdhE family)